MSNKMMNCKACGQQIASSAKACPNCGAKVKKPVYKKWWFWTIIVIIVLGIIAGASGGDEGSTGSTAENANSTAVVSENTSNEKQEITYTSYDVTELFDMVDTNAMKAQKELKGQHVEIHGYLSNIDSDGKYISVGAQKDDYDYLLKSIHCSIKSSNKEEIKNKVMEMYVDQPITVKGKVTDVGEVLGIYLDIDSIE